ncbi:MAG: sensor histidine kinase [Brumimicrobium sp.]|nr:sensor histidine kinase [Brumimicrobium sp.]
MLDFLRPPIVESDNFQKQIKTKFVWRIVLLTTIGIGILSIMSLIFGPAYFYLFISAFVFSLICLIALSKVGPNYHIIISIMYIGIIGAQFKTILIPEDAHFIESLYSVLIALFAFFTLGKWWGYFYLLVTAALYIIFFNFHYLTIEEFEVILQNGSLHGNSMEFIISMFLLGYVMFHYEKLNEHAKELYTGAIANLRKEKGIVEEQNKEKTVMLQEIHHRVKNNLQVIVSLLRMQSDTLSSAEAKMNFSTAINRIITMSLVHQKMYEKDSLKEINLHDYIESLVKDIISVYNTKNDISYKLSTELESLNPEKIVPLGLILNELISNSLKYSFEKDGRIEITISSKIDSDFTMLYYDNGHWNEDDKDTSFGLDLVDVFTDQLDGIYECKVTELGTYYYFKLKDSEPRRLFEGN